MKKLFKLFLTISIFLLIFIFCLIFALSNSYITTNYLLKAVNKTFDTNIRAESIKISFIDSSIDVENFSFDLEDKGFSIDHCKNLHAKINLLKLLEGKLSVKELSADDTIARMYVRESDSENLRKRFFLQLKRKKISLLNQLKCEIQKAKFNNFSLNLNVQNLYTVEIRDADINIPQLKANSELKLTADNFSSTVIFPDMCQLNSVYSTFALNSKLNNLFSPDTLNISLSLKNLNYKINSKTLSIPILDLSSDLVKTGNKFKINNLDIIELDNKSQIKSKSKITGNFSLCPFAYELNIESDFNSEKIPEIITSIYTFQEYNFENFKFSGEIKSEKNLFASKGIILLKKFYCKALNNKNEEALNSELQYDFSCDDKNKSIKIDKFDFILNHVENNFLSAKLDSPLEISSSKDSFAAISGKFNLSVILNNFNLSYIKLFFHENYPEWIKKLSGTASSSIALSGDKDNSLNAKIRTNIKKLNLHFSKKFNINSLNIDDVTELSISNFKRINIQKNRTDFSDEKGKLLTSSLTGTYNITKQQGDVVLKLPQVFKNSFDLIPVHSKIKNTVIKYLDLFKDYFLSIDSNIKFDINKNPLLLKSLTMELMNQNKAAARFLITSPVEVEVLKNKRFFFSDSFSSSLELSDFELNKFSPLIAKYNTIIESGSLSGNLSFNTENKLSNLSSKGTLNINNLSGKYNDQVFKDVNIYQEVDTSLLNLGIVNYNKIYTNIKYNDITVSEFELSGAMSKISQTFAVDLKKFYLDCEQFNNLSEGLLVKLLHIKSLLLAGDISLFRNTNSKTYEIKNSLTGSKLTFNSLNEKMASQVFSGKIDSDLIFSKNNVQINNLKLVLDDSESGWGTLTGDGNVCIPLSYNDSSLELTFDDVRMKKLISLYKSFPGSFKVDLAGADFDIDLTANNLNYGDDIKIDLHTNISKLNEAYSIRPIIADLNGANVFATFDYTDRKNIDDSFNMTLKTSNLNVQPFLKLYKPKIYDNASGVIRNLEFKLSAEGYSDKTFKEKLRGDLKAKVDNISFNDNIEDFDLIRILFVPFEVLSQTEQLLSSLALPEYMQTLMSYSDNVFSNSVKLKFNSSDIDIKIQDSKALIRKFDLEGSDSSFRSIDFRGSITFDKYLNLYANINLNNYIKLPLRITGSISAPNPDVIKFTSFIKETIIYTTEKAAIVLVEFPEKFTKAVVDDGINAIETAAP